MEKMETKGSRGSKGRAELKNVKQAANSTPNLCRTAASVVNNNLRQNGTESRPKPRQGTGHTRPVQARTIIENSSRSAAVENIFPFSNINNPAYATFDAIESRYRCRGARERGGELLSVPGQQMSSDRRGVGAPNMSLLVPITIISSKTKPKSCQP